MSPLQGAPSSGRCPSNTRPWVSTRAARQHMFNVSYSLKHRHCPRKYYFSLVFSYVTASLGHLSIKDIENTSPLESRCIELPTELLFYALLLSVSVFYLHDSLRPSHLSSWKCVLLFISLPSHILPFYWFCSSCFSPSLHAIPTFYFHFSQAVLLLPFPALIKCSARIPSSPSVPGMGPCVALPFFPSPLPRMVLLGAAFLLKIM